MIVAHVGNREASIHDIVAFQPARAKEPSDKKTKVKAPVGFEDVKVPGETVPQKAPG